MVCTGKKNLSILIVEDDEFYGDIMSTWLRQDHYQVVWGRDIETALSHLESEHFDLILTDLGLPRYSRKEVLQQFSQQEIPVIVLTALFDPEEKAEALSTGFADYIQKTIGINDLRGRINQLFANQ